MFLPLLGERVGVRAVVSAHFNSMSGSVRGAESGVLRILRSTSSDHFEFAVSSQSYTDGNFREYHPKGLLCIATGDLRCLPTGNEISILIVLKARGQ